MNLHNVPVWYMEEIWQREDINEWWLDKHYGPTNNLISNVRIGDIFSLHESNQFGLITSRTINVGADIESYYTYDIAGDIGGHWYHPTHEWLRTAGFSSRPEDPKAAVLARESYGIGYARFFPQVTQLMELCSIFRDDWFAETAGRLCNWYTHHPFDSTQRGDLARKARGEERANVENNQGGDDGKVEADGLEE